VDPAGRARFVPASARFVPFSGRGMPMGMEHATVVGDTSSLKCVRCASGFRLKPIPAGPSHTPSAFPMKNRFAIVACGLALLLAAAPMVCRAAVIYDNLTQPSGGSDGVGTGGLVQGPLYDSFSTGTGSGFQLTSVQLLLSNGGGSAGTTSIGIYTNNAVTSPPSPGSLLATIGTVTTASLSGTASVWNVSLGSPLSLAAGTRYWVGLSTSNNASTQWFYASSSAGTGVANEYLSNSTGNFANADIGPYQMSVNVVPEPSVCVMALVSVASVGWGLRRLRAPRALQS
jgi:hypothetical protein